MRRGGDGVHLYLIRHAQAERVGAGLVRDDRERPLSAQGREAARGVARKLTELGVSFDGIATSPLMRAAQTAEITACATGYEGLIQACPFLARTGRWRNELDGLLEESFSPPSGPPARSMALVGHNPDLGDLLTTWLDLPQGAFLFPMVAR